MLYSLKPRERKIMIEQKMQDVIEKNSMYWDYYIGGGRQWMNSETRASQVLQTGIQTRSGKYIYDLTPEMYTTATTRRNWQGSGNYKVYEWGELNILDVVVDETAMTTRGFGKNKLVMDGVPDQANEDLNLFLSARGGDIFIQDTSSDCLIYGSKAFAYNQGNIEQIKYDEYFTTDDSFVKTFNTVDNHQFAKEYTAEFIYEYLDGDLVSELPHDFGMIPVVYFENQNGQSMIGRDIPVQDNVNGILTRVIACMKDNLSPAFIVSDDDTQTSIAEKQDRGEDVAFKTGPGTVTILGKDGKASYQSWAGLPNGVMDFMNNIQKIYFAKKGINIFEKAAIPESGEAKKEVRRNLYNRCQYLRDSMYNGFHTMAKLHMRYNGFKDDFGFEINWADLVEIGDRERKELAMMDYTIHNNKRKYFLDIGYTEEQIDEILIDDQIESII